MVPKVRVMPVSATHHRLVYRRKVSMAFIKLNRLFESSLLGLRCLYQTGTAPEILTRLKCLVQRTTKRGPGALSVLLSLASHKLCDASQAVE